MEIDDISMKGRSHTVGMLAGGLDADLVIVHRDVL